ncbi:DUF5011 domain-containing protein [Flavobacteriaceae bacterium]|nr:DUF5011 domain-containing protein [Flavobacteriaceae bacterium]
MKNYLNRFGMSVVFILTTAFALAQKPPKQEVYEPQPTLMVLSQNQSYSRNNLSAITQDLLGVDSASTFEFIKQDIDELGFTHDVYRQFYGGLPVEFAQLKVHAKEGQVSALTNTTVAINDLDTRPTLSARSALNSAKSFVNARTYLWEDSASSALMDYQAPEGELMILKPLVGVSNQAKLVYKFDIYALDPVYRADVYVDAQSGAVVFENKRIHHANTPATGSSLYNGTVSFTADSFSSGYRLRQTVDGNGIETYDMGGSTNYSNASDVVSSTTNFSGSTDIGVQAHWGAEQTHKYFMQKHNRNSYTGTGSVIRSYVSYSRNYVNAFWNGSVMTYGDGDGNNYGPLVSLDIVGHEITHGVTEYAANLVYSYESGALNESFSDIFGESIEFFGSGTNDWLMGDEIGAGGSGGALRSMSNPNQFGDPDTYLGTNWYSGSGDNGGVHYNSGVQNFWFYLLSTGGTGTNDFDDPYDVPGIGMDAAAAIAYRNLTVYLSTNSQYADARTGAIQSAIDLYGENSTEVEAVIAAWAAVGLPPPVCQPNPIELSITFDNYPQETSWQLTDADGNTLASEDYSTSNPEGPTVNVTFPTLTEGTYFFTISDSYGDGICCSYGNGSYSLSSPNGVFKTGGSFGSSETTEMCITTGVDETPPVITVLGDNPFNLFVGQTFNDPGATAIDNVNGDISGDIVVTGAVNTGIAGTYTLTYDVTDAAGNAAETQTRTVNVNQDQTPPTVPTNLSATGITTTSFTLSWNASTDNVGVDRYEVFIDGLSQGTQAGTSTLISGLNPSTQYSAAVRALDAAGNPSNQSNSLSVTTATPPDTIAPTVPGNLTASNVGETSLDLSWAASTDNVGVSGYEIFQEGNSLGTTTTTSYNVSSLSPETTYGFSVRAYDASSNYSAQSAVLSVTTLAPPPDTEAPTVPVNLNASSITDTSFLLSWSAATDNVGVVGYNVYVGGLLRESSSNTNSLFEGLSPSTTYSVQVSAYDAAGNESNLSAALNVTTQDPPDTQAPTVPTELTVSNPSESSLEVSWNPSNDNVGVIGYELRQNGQSQGTFATNFTVQTGLNSNTEYTYQVRAYDAAGNFCAWSAEASARTLEPLPTCDDGIQNNGETGVDCGGPNCAPCVTTVTIHEGYFESGWDGWIDGGSDCSRYTGGTYAYEGISAINIQDNSGTASSMSLQGLDLTPYETVTLSFHYYVRSMEFGEDFFLQYYDGSQYTTIGQWREGFEFPGDGFYSDEITLNAAEYQNFSNNAGFRFYCDASGNADDIYIDAIVIIGDLGGPDTVPPVITLNGDNPMNLTVGDTFNDPGATASDNIDGDLTSEIVATGMVDTATPGTYTRTYTVADSAGNTASVNRTVIVEADIIAPVITLNGANPMEVYLNQPYNEPGATAFDNVDGDLTSQIIITGQVNTSLAGVYTVNYTVSDAAGNQASVNRRVNVIADTTPPVLTLLGANPMELIVGDPYVEPGYTATDNVDGDLSNSVVVTGSVNISVAGANTLTYSVTDSSSNTTSVTRVVNVNEASNSVVVHEECFEGGWGDWIDGGSDCQYYSGLYSPEQNSSVRIRDNSGVSSSMTLNNQDLSAHTTFSFRFLFQGVGMNNGEDFWLMVRDGNGSWNMAAQYIFGVDVVTGTIYEATVTFNTANFNNPNNISFRLQNDASSNNDQVYIDCVVITGDPGSNLMEGIVPIQTRDMGDDMSGFEYDELTLAPVPAKTFLNVAMSGLSQESTYTIYSVLGQKVQQGIIGDGAVDVKALSSGIYVFEVYDDEERQIKSFVKE